MVCKMAEGTLQMKLATTVLLAASFAVNANDLSRAQAIPNGYVCTGAPPCQSCTEYSWQDAAHQHVREIPVAPQCSAQGQRPVGSSRLYFGPDSGSSQAAPGATVVGLGVMSQVLSDIL